MSVFYMKFNRLKETAEHILSEASGIETEIPIDIDLLAENLGFTIIPVANFKEQITREAFLSPNTKEIFVDQDLYCSPKLENRYRFSIAHEISHYYLHLDYYKSKIGRGTSIDKWTKIYSSLPDDDLKLFEYQANVVVGCILIPDSHLDIYFPEALENFKNKIDQAKENGIDRNSYIDFVLDGIAQKLSQKFNVSNEAMIYRFKDYKYLDQIP